MVLFPIFLSEINSFCEFSEVNSFCEFHDEGNCS